MNYNDFYLEGTDWVGTVTKEEVEAANGKPVYSGLFICPNPENKTEENDPENHGLLPSEIEAAINKSMENGADRQLNVVVFWFWCMVFSSLVSP